MSNNKKTDNSNLWSKMAIAVALGVVLVVGIVVIALISFSNLFSGVFPDGKLNFFGNDYAYSGLPVNSHTTADSLSVKYVGGGELYVGGQVIPENFEVVVHYKDGYSEEIHNYESMILDDAYRLVKGSNTIVFYYGNLSAAITLQAMETDNMLYAPNYVLHPGDKNAALEKVTMLETGTLTYKDAFLKVGFTGDSQIKALSSFGIIPDNQIVAKVGESLEYMEANMDNIIALGSDKDVLIVHYGINTLSTSSTDRAARAEHYKNLLLRLKNALPNTRIVVSGVFPVADSIYYNQQRFAYINDYNQLLFEMCCEIGVEYLSDNEYMTAHQEVFSGDGLHLTKEFYTNYWLKNIILTLGV